MCRHLREFMNNARLPSFTDHSVLYTSRAQLPTCAQWPGLSTSYLNLGYCNLQLVGIWGRCARNSRAPVHVLRLRRPAAWFHWARGSPGCHPPTRSRWTSSLSHSAHTASHAARCISHAAPPDDWRHASHCDTGLPRAVTNAWATGCQQHSCGAGCSQPSPGNAATAAATTAATSTASSKRCANSLEVRRT